MILNKRTEKLIIGFEKTISKNRMLGKNQEKELNKIQKEFQKLQQRVSDIALTNAVRRVIRTQK